MIANKHDPLAAIGRADMLSLATVAVSRVVENSESSQKIFLAHPLLDDLATNGAQYFNASLSLAVGLADGRTFTAAAGVNDRTTGSLIEAESRIPAGSATKALTSIASMRLADAGTLKLDEPVYKVVDPWLKSQGHASLLETWGGDATITTVTARMLLSMRSGIPDYDDYALRQWTLANPNSDFLPINFLQNVSKKFLFQPGHGGSYSGVGYVLMGMTLCAVTNCSSWADLQQKALIENGSAFKFEHTEFMTTGPCSRYTNPPVVHQYMFTYGYAGREAHVRAHDAAAAPSTFGPEGRQPLQPLPIPSGLLGLNDAVAAVDDDDEKAPRSSSQPREARGVPSHCSNHHDFQLWYPKTGLKGKVMASHAVKSGGATACCAAGDAYRGAQYWTFVGTGEVGTCLYYGYVYAGTKQANATSGRVDQPISESEFIDIYGASCLNGWTMGNVATTPSDVARLYQALFSGALVSPSSLQQMTSFQPLTTGFNPGAECARTAASTRLIELVSPRADTLTTHTHPRPPPRTPPHTHTGTGWGCSPSQSSSLSKATRAPAMRLAAASAASSAAAASRRSSWATQGSTTAPACRSPTTSAASTRASPSRATMARAAWA